MKLPPLNGFETYMAVRAMRPDVVVIIISGYLQDMGDLAQQAVQNSAYMCLEKPVDMENLLSLFERIVEQRKERALKKLQ